MNFVVVEVGVQFVIIIVDVINQKMKRCYQINETCNIFKFQDHLQVQLIIAIAFVLLIPLSAFAESYPDLGVKVETVAENLVIPWSIDFAYDGRIFFSERTGTLQVIDKGIQKQIMALDVGGGEGGMLGIALDPDFEKNH